MLFPLLLAAQTVRFRTTQGDIDVLLQPEIAPRTVANFMNYVNKNAYDGTFFHRSVKEFVIQGGGFKWGGNQATPVAEDPPVLNEYRTPNRRGTIAMAKTAAGPNSATNQWFFNLSDNNVAVLDTRNNGGFTVFGRVTSDAGLAVMDKIAATPIFNVGGAFNELPLVDYNSGAVAERNLVVVTSVRVVDTTPAIADNAIFTASGFGGYRYAAPGSHVEIYGARLGPDAARTWAATDFDGPVAPTTVENVSVTVNGVRAAISYVSASQVNIQLPTEIPTGGTVSVVVNYRGATGNLATFAIRERAPGILAPPTFKVGDKQYVVAVRPNGTFVGNGSVPGTPNAPAAAGETIVLYGTGFGPVTPSSAQVFGRVAEGTTQLVSNVDFFFGDARAVVSYAGLAPGLVGVYQFNVVVPSGVRSGDQPLRVVLASEDVPQSLLIPMQ